MCSSMSDRDGDAGDRVGQGFGPHKLDIEPTHSILPQDADKPMGRLLGTNEMREV